MRISYFFNRIVDVKIEDYLSLFPMIIALIIKPLYKKKYQGTWLICEEPSEARDNGYHFFKYMCENQPQQKCYYAIKNKSVDALKVKKMGNIIEYGSVQHWIAYLICDFNISSQKGGKPNAAVCAFFELNNVFKPRNIFLQHGVTINNVKWLYSDVSRIEKFITTTTDETNFIQENFGYPKESVVMTGFPRFDELHSIKINKGQIVIMPTWRYWFNLKSKRSSNIDSNITTSEYVKKWTQLLESLSSNGILKQYKLNIVFYLHRNMQDYIENFIKCANENIIIASWKEYDIQKLLINSELMITDYSSVFFDMVYMKKPVLFYQFDKKDYRKLQYGKGYFDYENNKFGISTDNVELLIEALKNIYVNNCVVSKDFIDEHKRLFPLYDNHNSERVYKMLMGVNFENEIY